MIFRQLFDNVSSTYTYVLAGRPGGEALIIDPVVDKVDHYLRVIEELGARLVKAVDTHTHADHVSGIAELRDRTSCVTVMGQQSLADCVSMRVRDGDTIDIDGLSLRVIYTPGHTDDSYSFAMDDRLFTGDTLLIRGTGRTDFQNGDPGTAYESIFDRLLTFPEDTLVYPGHDYKGDTVSTIGEEIAFSPRLQVKSQAEYVALMDALDLPNPRMMDVAVPANRKVGFSAQSAQVLDNTLTVQQLLERDTTTVFVDLREDGERTRDGVVPGSIHVPYLKLHEYIKPGGVLPVMASQLNELVLYCAYGERSALALQAMADAGIGNIKHMAGGLDAWVKAGGAVSGQVQ